MSALQIGNAAQALVKEGLIKGIGLSEVSAEDIRRAHAVHSITAVELEWSLFTRDCEVCAAALFCIHKHILLCVHQLA